MKNQILAKVVICIMIFMTPMVSFGFSIEDFFEEKFGPIASFVENIVFFEIPLGPIKAPFVVVLLILGGIYFTFYLKFSSLFLFKTAIRTARGDYDEMDYSFREKGEGESVKVVGEITHFQALTTAISGTVGLGNISGVSVAIALGGPGAILWMIIAGFLGMSIKMIEATLGVKYRKVDADGTIYGGPMYYLTAALKGYPGKILAFSYAIFMVGSSFGSGNMFQSNQVVSQIVFLTGWDCGFYLGLILAIIVGLVIIGGLKRITKVTEKVVPFMGIFFVVSCIIIIGKNYDLVPEAIVQIFNGAFSDNAMLGGFLGVMFIGFKRAAFSNEAGVGSASVAHSAVKTRFPASEGVVAIIGPFIDTIIICTITALVIVVTNLDSNLFDYSNVILEEGKVIMNGTGKHLGGVDLTSVAFDTLVPNFSILLTIAVVLFALSTILSWSYYGMQGWIYVFGKGKTSAMLYKILFLLMIVIGGSIELKSVIKFADAMLFSLAFPNMIGLFILAPKVKQELKRYLDLIKSKA